MADRRNALLERFFTALISGDRPGARGVLDEVYAADAPAQRVVTHLFWPTLEQLSNLHRHDQITQIAYHFGTRLLRMMVDQLAMRLEYAERNGQTVLLTCGEEEAEELAAQMASDLLEAAGYTVYFAGGGIANDEIVAQLGEMKIDKLVVFGALPSTVPQTRLLIDHLHDIGACPNLQVIVGGGVFNRAEGLAEEIGADLWANDPAELVMAMQEEPTRRMSADQRTVGRRRRQMVEKIREAA
jgi:methanogenic corrinoid protein MtbC1